MNDQIPPRRRTKSRNGCARCKQRRIKCDEKAPLCGPCIKRGFECPGYARPLKWYQQYRNSPATDAVLTARGCHSGTRSAGQDNAEELAQPSPAESGRCSMGVDTTITPQLWGCGNASEGLLDISNDFSAPFSDQDLLALFGSEKPTTTADNGHTENPSFSDIGADALNLILDPQDSSDSMPSLNTILPSDQNTLLSKHYFSLICSINSCFDSPCNPLRSYIGELMPSCPLVFHCVMTMSAAHIGRREKSMTEVAIQHRNEAVLYLPLKNSPKGSEDIKMETILGSILLGVTSAWHDPSSLGLAHLQSGRALFRQWMGTFQLTGNNTMQLFSAERHMSLLVGAMAYWEALTSFLTDGDLASLEYLAPFCSQQADSVICPNPWTGASTPLFIYFAQAAVLSRQNRLARSLSAYFTSSAVHNEIYSKQLQEAARIEHHVLSYVFPETSRIKDTGDERTSLEDLETLGKIYRFVVLLQLYTTFPDLLAKRNEPDSDIFVPTDEPKSLTGLRDNIAPRVTIVALATTILNLISSVSESSGIKVLLTLPLLVAGSALQELPKQESPKSSAGSLSIIEQEMRSLHSSQRMISHWRSFVRQRLNSLYEYVGLDPIMRAARLLELVWTKADMMMRTAQDKTDRSSSKRPFSIVHWIDIMVEERLESIFG